MVSEVLVFGVLLAQLGYSAPVAATASSGTLEVAITTKNLLPYISFGLGTPARSFSAVIDTSSSSIWVPQKSANNIIASSSNLKTAYSQQYSTGAKYTGSWYSGKLTLQNKVTPVYFGVASTSETYGVVGLAHPQLEAASYALKSSYAMSLPYNLRLKKTIGTFSYGFNLQASLGKAPTLKFGGYDTTLAGTSLAMNSMTSNEGQLALKQVLYNGQTLLRDLKLSIDTSSHFSRIGQSALALFAEGEGRKLTMSNGVVRVDLPCDFENLGYFTFQLQSGLFEIPVASFIIRQADSSLCSLTFMSLSTIGDSSVVLGASALKYLYTYIDLEKFKIGITGLPETKAQMIQVKKQAAGLTQQSSQKATTLAKANVNKRTVAKSAQATGSFGTLSLSVAQINLFAQEDFARSELKIAQ